MIFLFQICDYYDCLISTTYVGVYNFRSMFKL